MNSLRIFIVRLYGLLVIAVSVLILPSYFGEVLEFKDNRPMFILLYWLPVLVALAVGIVMALAPNKVVGILPRLGGDVPLTANVNDIGGWIVIGVGVYVLVQALSDAVFHVANFFVSKSLIGDDFTLEAYNYPYFVATLIELLAAIIIIRVGRRIADK